MPDSVITDLNNDLVDPAGNPVEHSYAAIASPTSGVRDAASAPP